MILSKRLSKVLDYIDNLDIVASGDNSANKLQVLQEILTIDNKFHICTINYILKSDCKNKILFSLEWICPLFFINKLLKQF